MSHDNSSYVAPALSSEQRAKLETGASHSIEEIRSPINITVRCSCGWSRTFTRRQNALARAAKIRAAIREHLEQSQ